ncbi:AglZ/HisF2 family acetamidino modification protein [Fibrobacterota bacterium]
MMMPRVIPSLLLKGDGLVKGANFKEHVYVGDPINAVRIFNEKEVDELLFLDIAASRDHRLPSLGLIERIADECFMPFGVGGGINSTGIIRDLLSAGAEKVCINTAALEDPSLISRAADMFGSQSIVISIDAGKGWKGTYRVYSHSGRRKTKMDPSAWAREAEALGAGEILLTSIDREGTGRGYDRELTASVSERVNVPVIANGGAGNISDVAEVVNKGNASAAAAGSLFVFHGRLKAVLINFPSKEELKDLFSGGSR